MDARARFLAAVDTIADHQDGAGRLCAACVLAVPVQRAGIVLNVSGIGMEVLAASDQVADVHLGGRRLRPWRDVRAATANRRDQSGALDLYSAAGAPLGATDFADAIAISELVTAGLFNGDRDGRIPGSLGSWWNQPLGIREVHQATGMVMAQLGVDARTAYVRLQAFAFGNSRLLRNVSSDVVNRRKRFHQDPEGDLTPEQEAPTW